MRSWHAAFVVPLGSIGLLASSLGCATRQTSMEYGVIDSPAMGRPMRYGVYVPPAWDRTTPIPLVVFLHGAGDDERCLQRHGVDADFDEGVRAGRLPPFLAVVPDGEHGFWVNWHDGSRRYADYVLDDVLPHVRARYAVDSRREATHLMGISMGGVGAIDMAIGHPDVFATAAVLSAPLFGVDRAMAFLRSSFWRHFARVQRVFGPPVRAHVEAASVYTRLRSASDLHGLRLLIGAGSRDRRMVGETTRELHDHLVARAVPHHYLVYRGRHRWADWRRVLPATLCTHLRAEGACDLPADPFYRLDAVGAPVQQQGSPEGRLRLHGGSTSIGVRATIHGRWRAQRGAIALSEVTHDAAAYLFP